MRSGVKVWYIFPKVDEGLWLLLYARLRSRLLLGLPLTNRTKACFVHLLNEERFEHLLGVDRPAPKRFRL